LLFLHVYGEIKVDKEVRK